ncbi:hypothetical protein OAF84_03050 [Akkermansiaceae bacterium]|nr:hypothetical protein [Akkermansiaceae bacterium]
MMKLGISIIMSAIIVIGVTFFLLREGYREDLSGNQVSGRISGLVASEELILELTKELKGIARDLQNFSGPTFGSDSLKKLTSEWADGVDYFDSASLKIVKGEFLSDSQDDYVAEVVFHAVARTQSEKWRERDSSYRVRWSRKEGRYEMGNWTLIREVDEPEISRKYFRDRLVEALPDLPTRRLLTQSSHQGVRRHLNRQQDR